MEEGRPTGIKRQDAEGSAYVTFEGKRGQVISYDPISSPEEVVLGFGDSHLILYGYLRDDEFMEVDRESID